MMRFKNLVLVCFIFLVYAVPAYANSGLPLPRFVSLESSKTNVRAGPGKQYPIKWVMNHKNMPVEVILEFDNWRKIRDLDGQEGWVYHSLLSGKRTAIILGDKNTPAFENLPKRDKEKPRVVLYLEPRVVVNIRECQDLYCYVEASGYLGWVSRNSLWGVYESEIFD